MSTTATTTTKQEDPGCAVTRAGAGTSGSWIDAHVLQHPNGGPQVI
jgi:hypothetical protein